MRNFTIAFCALAALLFSGHSFAQSSSKDYLLGDMFIIGYQNNQTNDYVDFFRSTMPQGHQQMQAPRFMIVGKDNKFILGIGGFVDFRTGYDFDRVVDNKDFIPYDIPMSSTPQSQQAFFMDASTSRIGLHMAATNGRMRGLVANVEMDFRGADNTLRLRSAYVQYWKFLVGQTTTTFADLLATPTTLDFEGPNAYSYRRNLQVRFTQPLAPGLTMAVAAEMPEAEMTINSQTEAIPQRMPDMPLWFQYNWTTGHVRGSAIFRDLSYYNMAQLDNINRFGWGVQLSGRASMFDDLFTVYYQGMYGAGIGRYIQDLQGNGMDLVPDNTHANRVETMKSLACFGGASVNLYDNKLMMNMVYSIVNLYYDKYTYAADMYQQGQYITANLIWQCRPSMSVGVEYNHGIRENFDNSSSCANRVQVRVRYNF